jgi:two-component system sensor histidine kinase ChvG
MRGVRLTTSIDRDVVVRASDDLLETVLENVLDNAVSFSPAGGELNIALRRTGEQAEITVEDDGPGVPEEDLERIFERQYTKRPVSQEELENGTVNGETLHAGIGLWVVRRNLEAIGGSVYAENGARGGLVLHLEMPVAGKV